VTGEALVDSIGWDATTATFERKLLIEQYRS